MLTDLHRSICSVLVLFLVAVTGTHASGGTGKRVVVQVDGMACPFCAYSVEKRIKTLDAVPDEPNYEASVEEGQVSFDWKANEPVDRSAIREQVEKAGFTPSSIRVRNQSDGLNPTNDKENEIKTFTGVARLITHDKETYVQLKDTKSSSSRTLVAGERVDRQLGFAQLKQFLKRVQKEEETNAYSRVTIRGTLVDEKPDEVRLMSWEPRRFQTVLTFQIDGLKCQKCAARVMKQVGKLDGVIRVEADFENNRARVWSDAENPDPEAIQTAVKQAGFTVTRWHARTKKEVHQENEGKE